MASVSLRPEAGWRESMGKFLLNYDVQYFKQGQTTKEGKVAVCG
jgi:hypothetical protein